MRGDFCFRWKSPFLKFFRIIEFTKTGMISIIGGSIKSDLNMREREQSRRLKNVRI